MHLVVYAALLFLSSAIRFVVIADEALAPALLDRLLLRLCGADFVLPVAARLLVGLLLGLLLGASASRILARFSHAAAMRDLTAELANGLAREKPWRLALAACLGAIAEEMLFRGVVQPWLGVWISALAFAAVHVRRRKRAWLWPLLALAFGMVASLAYEATGTLLAPITMHVLVNVQSQRRLDRLATRRQRRPLGGLLRT